MENREPGGDLRPTAGTEARRRLILGLGNPGEGYAETRHNVGFRTVEELARRRGLRLDRLECGALVGGDAEVLLAKPQTWMNRSGHAARCLVERHGFAVEEVLVVYDDLALPVGRQRLRPGGSPAGHRGMESVADSLRTDRVPRLRLGVASPEGPPPAEEWTDFVLTPFAEEEREVVREVILRAAEACETWLREGLDAAMNRFNG